MSSELEERLRSCLVGSGGHVRRCAEDADVQTQLKAVIINKWQLFPLAYLQLGGGNGVDGGWKAAGRGGVEVGVGRRRHLDGCLAKASIR